MHTKDAVALDLNSPAMLDSGVTPNNGKLINLGHILGKVICSPKF
jgi:hypothetical protein